ncbi:CCA tRNA nucleotidyltransferase [Bacillus thermotolerans]|uniref:CCA-adding enzyme n=1 Tax=Bacillus thermotolerans TaxID=1221996 RepID=A0A0F5HWA0_BACTR|nr:CCA tRNA nucleotidyltransferase [Bacillus thermotolerans]KKB37659.1 tRNA nucleotidyltransferase [Bacillus thermotolerans]KKB38474.1 tRNA nucleotidyltransferase [Bacillus thermotolerans]
MENERVFEQAAPLLKRLEEAGFEAYFVGGSVRDYLLGRPIGDVDIATSALPEEVKHIFPKTVDVGIEHGTVLVLWEGNGYEVTTFRTESDYKDFRRPEKVSFVRSLTEDLQRRDFTINAMAMDRTGRIIDPFGGKEALQQQQIQTVGRAEDRFSEDALRMMRAARFTSQLGFRLHGETEKALLRCASLLQHIAVERKLVEMEKLLAGRDAAAGIEVIVRGNLFPYLPRLEGTKQQLEFFLSYDVRRLTARQRWLFLLALIKPEESEKWLRSWRMPSKKIKYLASTYEWLQGMKGRAWTDFLLYQAGADRTADVEEVLAVMEKRPSQAIQLMQRYEELPIKGRKELAVTGKDLKEWKQEKGGPWMKQLLEQIEQSVAEGQIDNRKESIKEWLKACNLL